MERRSPTQNELSMIKYLISKSNVSFSDTELDGLEVEPMDDGGMGSLLLFLKEKNNRVRLIKEFQEIIFNDENASEVLSELAHDLDFYQPDEELRKESNSYYGDEKLEREIEEALKKSVTS